MVIVLSVEGHWTGMSVRRLFPEAGDKRLESLNGSGFDADQVPCELSGFKGELDGCNCPLIRFTSQGELARHTAYEITRVK